MALFGSGAKGKERGYGRLVHRDGENPGGEHGEDGALLDSMPLFSLGFFEFPPERDAVDSQEFRRLRFVSGD